MADPVIVADIGGTNARFALAINTDGRVSIRDAQSFLAEDYETIRDAADAFLESVGVKPKVACIAIAAPILDKRIEFTNSRWSFEKNEIQKALALKHLSIVNDFEALASGVHLLPKEDLLPVKPGKGDPEAPKIVLGPGTGLGQSLIVPTPDGKRLIVPTEGGHVGFSPRTKEEIDVMQFIAREHPRVSVERLLSGRGLVNIHRALCAISGTQRVSLQAKEITQAAVTKEYPIAVKAVDMFCSLLGAAVGDAVLCTGARGGVFLGGGILPKIRDVFVGSAFVDRFLDKGRMRSYMEDTPIDLIIGEGAGLIGAAAIIDEQLNAH